MAHSSTSSGGEATSAAGTSQPRPPQGLRPPHHRPPWPGEGGQAPPLQTGPRGGTPTCKPSNCHRVPLDTPDERLPTACECHLIGTGGDPSCRPGPAPGRSHGKSLSRHTGGPGPGRLRCGRDRLSFLRRDLRRPQAGQGAGAAVSHGNGWAGIPSGSLECRLQLSRPRPTAGLSGNS